MYVKVITCAKRSVLPASHRPSNNTPFLSVFCLNSLKITEEKTLLLNSDQKDNMVLYSLGNNHDLFLCLMSQGLCTKTNNNFLIIRATDGNTELNIPA